MEELRPLIARLRYYPPVLASLVIVLAIGVSIPVPEQLLKEVRAQYLARAKELEALLKEAATKDQVVYRFFAGQVGSVLASSAPFMGPLFAAYVLTSLSVGLQALVAERTAPLEPLLNALANPSVWLLLLAYTVSLVESLHLTQMLLRRTKTEPELTFSMLALAAVLTLLSATLSVAFYAPPS